MKRFALCFAIFSAFLLSQDVLAGKKRLLEESSEDEKKEASSQTLCTETHGISPVDTLLLRDVFPEPLHTVLQISYDHAIKERQQGEIECLMEAGAHLKTLRAIICDQPEALAPEVIRKYQKALQADKVVTYFTLQTEPQKKGWVEQHFNNSPPSPYLLWVKLAVVRALDKYADTKADAFITTLLKKVHFGHYETIETENKEFESTENIPFYTIFELIMEKKEFIDAGVCPRFWGDVEAQEVQYIFAQEAYGRCLYKDALDMLAPLKEFPEKVGVIRDILKTGFKPEEEDMLFFADELCLENDSRYGVKTAIELLTQYLEGLPEAEATISSRVMLSYCFSEEHQIEDAQKAMQPVSRHILTEEHISRVDIRLQKYFSSAFIHLGGYELGLQILERVCKNICNSDALNKFAQDRLRNVCLSDAEDILSNDDNGKEWLPKIQALRDLYLNGDQ